MFRDRLDAAQKLTGKIINAGYHDPLILGIPRGGVVIAAAIAQNLMADMDVILSRKIRAPLQPELAIGAVTEDGEVSIYDDSFHDEIYIEKELRIQLSEISRRRKLISEVLPTVNIENREVILTDDGMATGSTILASLNYIHKRHPAKVIVAVPVAPKNAAKILGSLCDELIVVLQPIPFGSVGNFYNSFPQVSDSEMLDILKNYQKERSGGTNHQESRSLDDSFYTRL